MDIIGLANAELYSNFRLTFLHPTVTVTGVFSSDLLSFGSLLMRLWGSSRISALLNHGSRWHVQCCLLIIWTLSELPREGGGPLLFTDVLYPYSDITSPQCCYSCHLLFGGHLRPAESFYTRQSGAREVF